MRSDGPTTLSVSLIIPVFNGGDRFRVCLQSLAQIAPQSLEVIVVADGDTDGSWQVAQDWGAQVIRLASSHGPAYARNLGAKEARGDILLFVDADVTVPRNIIEHVTTIMSTEPHVAALIGSYDDHPAATNFLSQYKNLFHHYVHQTSNQDASTFWGACGAIRRDVFFSVSGFDERYRFPSIEDIELGYRLKRAGHHIRLCKTLQVKHLKCWRIASLLKADVWFRALPWTNLIWREGSMLNDLNLGTTSRASVVGVYLLLSVLIGTFKWPALFVVAGIIALALFIGNAAVYRFFLQKRGIPFTLYAVLWHWFYYAYSGFAFAVGSSLHLVRLFNLRQRFTTQIVGPIQ